MKLLRTWWEFRREGRGLSLLAVAPRLVLTPDVVTGVPALITGRARNRPIVRGAVPLPEAAARRTLRRSRPRR